MPDQVTRFVLYGVLLECCHEQSHILLECRTNKQLIKCCKRYYGLDSKTFLNLKLFDSACNLSHSSFTSPHSRSNLKYENGTEFQRTFTILFLSNQAGNPSINCQLLVLFNFKLDYIIRILSFIP